MPKRVESVLAPQLDWDPIVNAVAAVGLESHENDEVVHMLWSACNKWLDSDYQDFEMRRIEEKWIDWNGGVSYLSDLLRARFGDNVPKDWKMPGNARYGTADITALGLRGKLKGIKVGIDWKTAGTLDKTWDRKMALSWQWKIYCHKLGLNGFIYRGIKRDGSTRELVLEWPMSGITGEDVDSQIDMLEDQRMALYHQSRLVWPRNMPHACGAYGRDCPRLVECHMGRMPKALPELTAFNYSGMDKFMLCQERYRRIIVEGGSGEDEQSPATRLGSAFHAGIAEVYRQVRESQEADVEERREEAA